MSDRKIKPGIGFNPSTGKYFEYGAIDPIGDQFRELQYSITIALSRLTIQEFKDALNIAMQYKETNGDIQCVSRIKTFDENALE